MTFCYRIPRPVMTFCCSPFESRNHPTQMKGFSSSSVLLTSFSLIIIIIVVTSHGQNFSNSIKLQFLHGGQYRAISRENGLGEKECNLFEGTWVWEEESRPLYEEHDCPYIEEVTCQAHGRPDKAYQHWRWQPHNCSLPKFNATFMLEMLRGKRMMFVGDSLNRGQFSSMVCLLQKVIPQKAKSFEHHDPKYVFKALNYDASIEFYWAPFLLESNCDNFYFHRLSDRTVLAGSIDKHGQHWKGVDILVFDTYIWWMTGMKLKIINNSTPLGDETKDDVIKMESKDAYRMGMKELVGWVEKNVDPKKSRVFFITMSPSHPINSEWGGSPDGNCYNETLLIEDPNYWGSYQRKGIMEVIREEFNASRVPITVVNITQLSEYRKDGHLSIYGKRDWAPTAAQLADPKSYADCFHWCVPGVPDTWNEILYTMLSFVPTGGQGHA